LSLNTLSPTLTIQWYPEMAHFCEDVPLLLICTKTDLRKDPQTLSLMAAQGTTPITSIEGEKVAKEIGARRYLECSAKEGRGVKEVFDAAVRESLGRKGMRLKGRAKKCVVL
jgi:Rho family protein